MRQSLGILGLGVGGRQAAASSPYYILDDFLTAATNLPLDRACEPGPGRVLLNEPGAPYNIAGGALQFTGTDVAGDASAIFCTGPLHTGIPRLDGLRIEFDLLISVSGICMVTLNSARFYPASWLLHPEGLDYALYFEAGAVDAGVYGTLPEAAAAEWSADTLYRARFTLKTGAGCLMQLTGAAFGEFGQAWTTIRDATQLSAATLWPCVSVITGLVTVPRVAVYLEAAP